MPNREDLPRPGPRLRLEVSVPAGLYLALRERARLLRKPLTAVVTVALEEYLYRAGRPPEYAARRQGRGGEGDE